MTSSGVNSPVRPPRRLRSAVRAGACAVLLLAGCRNTGGGWGGGGGSSGGSGGAVARGDPLLGGARIPPQNLPVPGRDGYSTRERKDPILGSPVGRDDRGDTKASKGDKAPKPDGEPTASLPPDGPRREPFRPGRAQTNAALAAGRMAPDDSALSIGDRHPAATPTANIRSGPVPLRPRDDGGATGGQGFDQITAELQRYKAKWDQPAREGDGYVFRCDVPIDAEQAGRVRRYEGAGPTPAAAAKQALDQVRGDKGGGQGERILNP